MLVDDQNWNAQMGAVSFDLDEKRVDATHDITSRHRVESSTMAATSTMRLDTETFERCIKRAAADAGEKSRIPQKTSSTSRVR